MFWGKQNINCSPTKLKKSNKYSAKKASAIADILEQHSEILKTNQDPILQKAGLTISKFLLKNFIPRGDYCGELARKTRNHGGNSKQSVLTKEEVQNEVIKIYTKMGIKELLEVQEMIKKAQTHIKNA